MSGATRDAAVTAALVITFATLVSVHVATLFGLGRRHRLAEAAGAFVLPPLAPYWAFVRGMRGRAIAWIGSAVLYVVALVIATR